MADTLEKDFILKQPLRDDTVSCWSLIFEGFLVAFLGLFPVVLILQTKNYKEYDIFVHKDYLNLNSTMEFWRYSTFIITLYLAYLVIRIALQLVPPIAIWFLERTTLEPSYFWRRQVYYLRQIKHSIVGILLAISFIFLSAIFIYHTSFIERVTPLIQPVPRERLSAYLLERFYVFTLICLLFYTLTQYFVQLIAYHYHRLAHASRIHDVNYKYEVLFKLYQATSRGIFRTKSKSRHIHYDGKLYRDDLGLTDSQRTEQLGSDIFSCICPKSRDYLEPEDLQPFFDQQEISKAFRVFSSLDTEQVTEEGFIAAINKIHEERTTLEVALACAQRTLNKLGKTLLILSLAVSILVGVALFKLETAPLVVVFGVVYVGINFTVQETLSELYNCCIFIFVKHPYDVGDKVIVRNETLLVDKIDLYTTIFRKWDHTAVYMANKDLNNSTIYNISRPSKQPESMNKPPVN